MSGEHVAHRSSSDGEKSGASEAVEEPCDEHGRHVGSHRAGDDPNDEHQIGPDIDWTTAVELRAGGE